MASLSGVVDRRMAMAIKQRGGWDLTLTSTDNHSPGKHWLELLMCRMWLWAAE